MEVIRIVDQYKNRKGELNRCKTRFLNGRQQGKKMDDDKCCQ